MFKRHTAAILLAVSATLGPQARALTTTLTQHGIVVNTGRGGRFTLSYPALGTADKNALPSQVVVQGRKLSARYRSGATVTGELNDDGAMAFHFTALPPEVQKIRFDLALPLALNQGGKFSIDRGNATAFPTTALADAFLFKGEARRMDITPAQGDSFAIEIEHGWQQMQDNRVWNMKTFAWMATAELPRTNGNEAFYTIRVAAPGVPASRILAANAPVNANETAGDNFAVKLGDQEISIEAGTAGTLSLKYPALVISGDKRIEPAQIVRDPEGVTLVYADGGKCRVRLEKLALSLRFSDLPAEFKQFRMEMLIPITFSGGGSFAIGGASPQAFPAEKPARPFLFQGNADRFEIVHPTGPGLSVMIPPYSYQQLQDNREWNWSVYDWWFACPLPAGDRGPHFEIAFAKAGASGRSRPVVDRFGQWIKVNFPTKVKTESELKSDAAEERRWLTSRKPAHTDPFGGLPGSGAKLGLEKTGFFHVGRAARLDGGSVDVLVTPAGNAFFQLGVCGISPCDDYTTVRGREAIYEWLPSGESSFLSARREGDSGVASFYLANTIRKYGQPYNLDQHFTRWIDRLRAWGFNSAGAFNAVPPVVYEKQFPYVNFVPIPAPKLGNVNAVWDPFAPDLAAKFDAAYAEAVAPSAHDPLLIGYFISNEPWLEEVPKVVPSLRASECPSKARLVAWLKHKYTTIKAFNAAWNSALPSFEVAAEQPLSATTKAAVEDMAAFFKLFLEARYTLVNTAFRKHDPNHLLIGDRLTPATARSEIIVRTAAKFVDVVSINYYTYGVDKNFLDRVHGWALKPMLLSEFYYAATDQGLRGGNKVRNQTERGLAYRNYVEQSAATGHVVGIQWFLALDQACTGRFFEGFNGEAANTGLVNVADRPYNDFLAEVMKTNDSIYDVILGRRPAFAFNDPQFAPKP